MSRFESAAPGTIPPLLWSPRTRLWHRFGFWFGATLLAAAILFAFNPVEFGFYPTCQFYRMTGLLCPGCGSLRAWHHLLHGHVLAALHFNPLAVFAIPLAGWWFMRTVVARRSGKTVLLNPFWVWAAALILMIFFVLRNLPTGPSLWLAP